MFGSEPDFFGSFHGVGLLIEPSSNGGGYNHNYDNNVGDFNANATERIPMCGPQLAGNLPLLPQRAMVGSRRALDIVDDGLQDEVLYRRSSSITLPRDSSPYTLAKRAENARDYKRALYWHTQCIEQGIRAASAVMDVAGLFNKFGKKAEALTFMAQYKHLVPKDRYQGFRRLYERVEYDLNRPAQVAPRMLMVTLLPSESIRDSGMELGDPPQWYSADAIAYLGKLEKGPLNVKLLDRLFPNPEKIEYLAICEADPDTGAQVAYVQFESQSSARKAMVTEKVLCNILVTWPDKMASMLPPPEDAVTDKHVVQDSERCITSPFEPSLVVYRVPAGWAPQVPEAEPDEMDLRRTNSVREDNTPSRLASSSTTPCSEKLTDVSRADLVDLRSTSAGGLITERVRRDPSSVAQSRTLPSRGSDTAGQGWALQFTQKMICINRMLEGIPMASSQTQGIILAETYESVGRFDAAFKIYADTAILAGVQSQQQLGENYEVVDCVIRCAVIAAIWGGSFETGCRILDCVLSAHPSLEFLSKTANNLASLMSQTVEAMTGELEHDDNDHHHHQHS